MIKIKIRKHYEYGVARGTTDGTREGWIILRRKVTPLLRLPYGKKEMLDHTFYSKDAAVAALNETLKEE